MPCRPAGRGPSRPLTLQMAMSPDLEQLIRLQQLDNLAEEARRRIADVPERIAALDARLAAANQALATARERQSQNQAARRTLEKDVAAAQGRLSKYKDQLMEVKTNREYQAMQKEIEVGQTEVRQIEDKILERMLDADDISASVKQADAVLASEKTAVASETKALERERAELEATIQRTAEERTALLPRMKPEVLALFEFVARGRKGVAVAEARDGLCTICHVRLRPQVFNDIRRNDSIIQCDSCQRILYFAPSAPGAEAAGSRS